MLSQDVASGQKTHWAVIAAPPQIAGVHPLELFDCLAACPPLLVIHDPLTEHLADVRLHWVRLFLLRGADGSVSGECKLDNEVWPEARARLLAYEWPDVPGYLAFRQFLLLQPATESVG